MKFRLIFIICFFLGLAGNYAVQSATIHTYASESILSQGRFLKVQITESGIYKITYNELQSKGIVPSNVRMFGYGGAVLDEDFSKTRPDDLPEIAVYDTGNAILFYAQGINKWTYNQASKTFSHKLNPYSKHGYYFITSENIGEKKRVQQRAELNTGSASIHDVSEFTDYRVHEQELYNIIKAGREFYGEKFMPGNSIGIPFDFPNLILSEKVIAKMSVINISTRTVDSNNKDIVNNKSTFSLKLNNAASQSLIINGNVTAKYEAAVEDTLTYHFTVNSSNVTANLSFANSKQATALGYLNYLEINAQRELKMAGTVMPFHNKKNIGTNSYNRYLLETTNQNLVIWNTNDILNVTQVPTSNISGKLTFIDSASQAKSYIAFDPTDLADIPAASLLNVVPNQNLHGMEPIDMLIITHSTFMAAAEKLAQAHYENSGLKVGIATTEQIYNEFSSGAPDVSAYRWITKMFYDRAVSTTDRIKYLLLIGKGSFDNRGLFQDTGDKFTLTYQAKNSLSHTKSYATDDYFGLLDDKEGPNIGLSDKIDVGIGRLPVRTADEADKVVNKIIRHIKNENKGSWKNQLCFMGDNGDSNVHMKQANALANQIEQRYPDYCINKILLDAYQKDASSSSNPYPGAKSHFQQLMNSGLLFVNYMGHGNANGWGSLLNMADIRALENENLPLFSSGTCEFSRFDKELISAGEALFKNEVGGAIGVFSASRTVYSTYNETIMKHFCDSLFALPNKTNKAVGDAVRQAKNATLGNKEIGVNTLAYVYFGDPAVSLNYPASYNVIATEINGTPIAGKDTLNALSVVTVKGIVANKNAEKQTDFSGELQLILQDKKQTKQTLQSLYEYTDRSGIIFNGKTKVENGEFEIRFMLPNNMKHNYGNGRLGFYASDNTNGYEAQGSNTNFIVGGINADFIDEQEGPDAAIYLNDRSFVSGDKVNNTPIFLADLYDLNGINTSSLRPGHDIMLCIDNETWYNLNDYCQIKGNNYQEGSIAFQLPKQTAGKHSLTFKAWDLLSNSTIKTLEFEVEKESSLQINCYPNPVFAEANFLINYHEGEIDKIKLDIFDLSGRNIWSHTQKTLDTISWNVAEQNGESAPAGMYIYRIAIQLNNGKTVSKSNKIIVTKQ